MIVDGSVRRNVDIIEVDTTEPLVAMQLSVAHGIASGKATTLEQALANSADDHRIVATTNGSLFSYVVRDDLLVAEMGLGLNVSDGELINAGSPPQRPDLLPAFALDEDGTPLIGTPELVANLTLPGGEVVGIDRINQVRFDANIVLYTSRLGSHTWTDNLGDEYVIDGFDLPLAPTGTHTGTVVDVRQDAGDTPIGPGQVVLSVSNTADPWATALAVGSTVTVSLAVDEGWGAVSQSVGGRNMLVVDSNNVSPQPDVDGSHTRTAVGIDAAGKIMLVTVDNESSSKGLRLTDAANLMISLGAVDAMNLDGGGSTQMAVRHPGDVDASMVTAPGVGGIYRSVANAVQIVSYAPDGPLDRLIVSPDHDTAAFGEQVVFTAKGQDAALNGLPLEPSSLDWTVEPVSGGANSSFQRQGSGISVAGDIPGDHVVTVRSGGLEARAMLTVTSDTTAPVVTMSELAFADTGAIGADSTNLAVGWIAVDDVGVTGVHLQRRVDLGSWKDVALSGPGCGVRYFRGRLRAARPVPRTRHRSGGQYQRLDARRTRSRTSLQRNPQAGPHHRRLEPQVHWFRNRRPVPAQPDIGRQPVHHRHRAADGSCGKPRAGPGPGRHLPQQQPSLVDIAAGRLNRVPATSLPEPSACRSGFDRDPDRQCEHGDAADRRRRRLLGAGTRLVGSKPCV